MEVKLLGAGDEELLIRAVELSECARLTIERATAHLADGRLVAVAAVDDNKPIGFTYGYVLPRFQHTELLIYSIDVDEAHRRRGAARALIERLKELCAERGWTGIWVLTNESNAPAMALYQSAGGVRTNRVDVMFDFTVGR